MPLYEYSCRSCENRFEVLQRLGEDAAGVRCPTCDHGEVEKVFSTFAAGGQNGRSSSELTAQPAGCCRGTPT